MDRKCLVYVDLESARPLLDDAGLASTTFVERVLRLTRAHGRVVGAWAYGDIDVEEAKALRAGGCETRLTIEDGEGSAPESIAIALDGIDGLVNGPQTDSVVLVTDDAQLSELVRRLRKAGRYVTLVGPQAAEAQPQAADRFVAVEQLVAGDVEAEPLPDAAPRREIRAVRPGGPSLDMAAYDWTRLVLLMRDLEAKMPFVGMRWLKNKVIGPHNVGAVTVGDKQVILNRAVDDGLIETYRVGNRDESGDPVTACRLIRAHPAVEAVLAAHPAPELPPPASLGAAPEANA